MSCIFLMGMPGAGKTYWGMKIAEAYQLSFTDLDEFIEQQEAKSIGEIFETYGEAGFRQIEAAVLKELIRKAEDKTIIACGGGTPVFENNLALMKAAGCVVYLRTDIEILERRLQAEVHSRPLLLKKYLKATLLQMLSAREDIYEQADHILQSENISIINFAQIISLCTGQH